METFSTLLALCAGNSPVLVNSPHKGQWRWALMFSLICVWINDWVNNREVGDLRRHRGHYDVNVMIFYSGDLEKNALVITGGVVCQLANHFWSVELVLSEFSVVKLLQPIPTFMYWRTMSSLVWVMVCSLFDTELILTYLLVVSDGPLERIFGEIWIRIKTFSIKAIENAVCKILAILFMLQCL